MLFVYLILPCRRLNLSSAEKTSEHEISFIRNVHTTVRYPYCASTLSHVVSSTDPTLPPADSVEAVARSGEVNFFNCMSIFYEYVAKVMKQSFDPEVLFEVVKEVVRQLPQDVTTYMVSIMYPTPAGIQMLTSDDVDAYWGNTNVRDVVLPKNNKMVITGHNGVHQSNKNDADVKAIYIHDTNTKYMPEGLGTLFNLTYFVCVNSKLVEINAEMFEGMDNLENLWLFWNKLTSVPLNAFLKLTKLKLLN